MPTYNTTGNTTGRPAKRPQKSSGGNRAVNNGMDGISGTKEKPVPINPIGGENKKIDIVPDDLRQRKAKKFLMDDEQLSKLNHSLKIANLYVNCHHLEMLSPALPVDLYENEVCGMAKMSHSRQGIAVYQISKLMYCDEENSFEKLASVYAAMNSFGGIIALIYQSNGKSTNMYICTNTSGDGKTAGDLMYGNLRGQFPGCEISKLMDLDKEALLESILVTPKTPAGRTVRSVSMIPSRREDEKQHDKQYSAQGFEKFVDAMKGQKYTLIILSQQISSDAMEQCVEGFENMYTALSPYSKESVSYSENESDSVNYSISSSVNSSISDSVSNTFGTSHTRSISEGRNSSSGRSGQGLFGMNYSSGQGSSWGSGVSDGTSFGKSTNHGFTEGYGTNDGESTGTTKGFARTMTLNRDNKGIQDILEKISEHIDRIHTSQTFGMWNSACYVISDDAATAHIGTSTLTSLFSGDSKAAPRAYYNQWDIRNVKERDKILEYLSYLMHPVINLTMLQIESVNGGGVKRTPILSEKITPASMISGKEIPIMMGLPKKSVPGIVVDHMAEFGRNIQDSWKKKIVRPILFGNIFHMGQPEPTQTFLDLDTFASHTFICGASGSGKSNTTYNLIQEFIDHKIPFLVIEPAKGEYKIEFAGLKGINVFTADRSEFRQLKLNPFEFSAGIHIREHLDNIVQVVSACWPLYGAMPGLLKKGFEKVYIEHGWDLDYSERIVNRGSKFPTFQDLITVLEKIIDEQNFSKETKSDYKGALVNRVSSLCNGFEGEIFGRSIGIADKVLFNENTIIDLSSIGSDETRSLIMGMLIIKLKSFRKVMSTSPNSKLIHVTILEEAHNILKRCSQDVGTESGNVQGAAVSSLCRCIAEMRSAGEGFMIIDQSPGAVDETAIKNTAIKIVMRLPSKTDCEEIGAALSLEENQIRELSRLDTGVAAIYHAGWTDTLLAKMGTVWSKRYRIAKKIILDQTVYIKVKSAIVQNMYLNLKNECYDYWLDEVDECMDFLCVGKFALNPVLPEDIRQEIRDDVRVFVEDNDFLIQTGDKKGLQREFINFVFDFLKLEGLFQVFELRNVKNAMIEMEKILTKEIKNIMVWEFNLRKGILRYLVMPENAEPLKTYKWPSVSSEAEYFWEIYEEIIKRYAIKNMNQMKYMRAYKCLLAMDHFINKGKK